MANKKSIWWPRIKVIGAFLIGAFLLLVAVLSFIALRNQDIVDGWKEKGGFAKAMIEFFASIPEGWLWLLAAVGLILIALWGWFFRKSDNGKDLDTEERVRRQLLKAAKRIIVPPDGASASGSKHNQGWKTENRSMLAGMLSAKFAGEFDECLKSSCPELAAKQYLEGLASRVDGALLRQSRLQRAREGNPILTATQPALVIEYNKRSHFIKADQMLSFTVRNRGTTRVEQIHVKIERLTPKTQKSHDRQRAGEFTGHELAPMRNPEICGFDLDEEEPMVMRLAWSTPDDPDVHFSGYDIHGEFRAAGFNTVKARYEVELIATGEGAKPGRARFHIGHTKKGKLTCSRID